MVLRDIVSPVSVDYFLAGPYGVLCASCEKGYYFQKFSSMDEICQLLSNRKYELIQPKSEIRLYSSMESSQHFLASDLTKSLPVFDKIQASQVFSVSTVVSLTKKSFEDFKQQHRNNDLLKDDASVVVSFVKCHYVFVEETRRKLLHYLPWFYMVDVKDTFSSPWVFSCGTDLTEANLTKENLLRNSLPDVRDMIRSCEPYLRIRETVIKCCPNQ